MDEQRADPHVTTATNTIEEIHRYLADQPSMEQLYRILCSYVSKFAMVPPQEVENEAYELLQNLVVKALELADRYHGVGVRPWLLRIAKNLILQKKESQARHN